MSTSEAVAVLREQLDLTQPEFAARLGVSLPSIQRYERIAGPTGRALVDLVVIARGVGRDDLADLFRAALIEELGPDVIDVLAPVDAADVKRRRVPARVANLVEAFTEFMITAPEKLGPAERGLQICLPEMLATYQRSAARKNTA